MVEYHQDLIERRLRVPPDIGSLGQLAAAGKLPEAKKVPAGAPRPV